MESPGYGCRSMVAPLRRVLVRAPDESFAVADPQAWGYTGRPDLERAREEHRALVRILEEEGAEVLRHDIAQPGRADAIFVHDPVLIGGRGAVLLRPGKPERRGEEGAMAESLEALGVPVVYRLHGDATAEGGDLLWLDEETLAVGRGFRTNAEGLRQLEEALAPEGVRVLGVPLPVHAGPRACLHLMSLISLVDHDLAVAYEPLLPVPFWELLRDRGVEIVPVPEQELATQGPNVLALAPRSCLMLEGNPVTRERLEAAGCRVRTYRGLEISLKAEGGATCLTRPLLRGG